MIKMIGHGALTFSHGKNTYQAVNGMVEIPPELESAVMRHGFRRATPAEAAAIEGHARAANVGAPIAPPQDLGDANRPTPGEYVQGPLNQRRFGADVAEPQVLGAPIAPPQSAPVAVGAPTASTQRIGLPAAHPQVEATAKIEREASEAAPIVEGEAAEASEAAMAEDDGDGVPVIDDGGDGEESPGARE